MKITSHFNPWGDITHYNITFYRTINYSDDINLSWMHIIKGSWILGWIRIRICIRMKNWIRTRIKVKIQELYRALKVLCRLVVADSHDFDQEPDPVQHLSEKPDLDPH
jgi:hypothetical protein